MAKPLKQRSEEEVDRCKYKWEFLRRNPEYRQRFKAYKRDAHQEGENLQEWERRVGTARMKKSRKEAGLLREEYGFSATAPPSDPNADFQLKPGMPFMPFQDQGVVVLVGLSFDGMDIKPHEMLLKVDLRKPQVDLLSDVKIKIDMEFKRKNLRAQQRAKINEELQRLEGQKTKQATKMRFKLREMRDVVLGGQQRETVQPSKKQLKLYKTYLVVWDLYKSGKSFVQITNDPEYRGLIPPDREGSFSENTVKTQYYAAKRLIEGGYKEL